VGKESSKQDKSLGNWVNKSLVSTGLKDESSKKGPLTGRQWALASAQYEMIFTPLEMLPRSVSSHNEWNF